MLPAVVKERRRERGVDWWPLEVGLCVVCRVSPSFPPPPLTPGVCAAAPAAAAADEEEEEKEEVIEESRDEGDGLG